MKFKKQKRHRKAVRFYSTCFGFREPFKVLFDGTFVHHLLTNNITPADTAMANTLGGPVKIFTTRCVLAELKSLGDSHAESFSAARDLLTARCDHEKRKSAVSCMIDVIGENNSEHFFVATQDAELRRKFQEIPGVPLVYGLRNALFIEKPSAFQYQYAKAAEEQRSHMSELECKTLNVRRRKMAIEKQDFSNGNEIKEDQTLMFPASDEANTRNKGKDTKDRVQFKRKRAKGPNPLSCKQKKTRRGNAADEVSSEKVREKGVSTTRSGKRKRSRKSKTIAGASVQVV